MFDFLFHLLNKGRLNSIDIFHQRPYFLITRLKASVRDVRGKIKNKTEWQNKR